MRPTIFVAVPRLFNKIAEAVRGKFGQVTGIKKCLVDGGLSSKLNSMRSDGSYKHGFYDGIVFSQVRNGFGGRVRIMFSGSAPLKDDVYEFMKACMCCEFL